MSRLVFGWLTSLVAGMPLGLGYFLADALTEVHFRLFPARRHAALANLAVILPRADRRERVRIARRMMRSYNRMMFEFFRLPHMTRAVAGVQFGRWLNPAVREAKTELSIHTISPDDGFRSILRALEHNECVALMVDGDVYRHGVTVDFFGRETRFPAGPGVLAQRSGALIICGLCERVSPGRFRVVIEPALDPARFESAAALNAAVAAITERHIRERIDQWCIFRPMWEGAAQTEPAPAGATERVRA
jgi:lauroyl/myristoyl acyltransferase